MREKKIRDQIRTEILKTGLDLFHQNGYANTSMRILSEKCNIPLGTIYRYYASKEDLVNAILLPSQKYSRDMLTTFISCNPMNEESIIKNIPKLVDEFMLYTTKFHKELLLVFKADNYGPGENRKEKLIDDFTNALLILIQNAGNKQTVVTDEIYYFINITARIIIDSFVTLIEQNKNDTWTKKAASLIFTHAYEGLRNLIKNT
jgi:AcrR family transcriptional regulator